MPNNQIDPSIARALGNAFGGGQPTPAPQPSAPAPSPSGDSGAGSLFHSLLNAVRPDPSPYENLANKATGKDYK